MCWRDMLDALRSRTPGVTDAQVRWAIVSGKVTRPPRDGSLRFVFGRRQLQELLDYFAARDEGRPPRAGRDSVEPGRDSAPCEREQP